MYDALFMFKIISQSRVSSLFGNNSTAKMLLIHLIILRRICILSRSALIGRYYFRTVLSAITE